MKALIMLNHLRYWPFTLVCLTNVITDFCYSSLACSKFNLIASKLVPLVSRLNMMLIKVSFIPISMIKLLFCVICLLFIIFVVLIVVPITFAKQKKSYMKGQLNIIGLIITMLFTNIPMNAQVCNICLILRLCIRHYLRHQHLFKTDKFDLRTARINLMQDNTEITEA